MAAFLIQGRQQRCTDRDQFSETLIIRQTLKKGARSRCGTEPSGHAIDSEKEHGFRQDCCRIGHKKVVRIPWTDDILLKLSICHY